MNKKGFTLIEVVLVIIVLIAIGTVTWRLFSSTNANVETRQITDEVSELLTLEEVNTVVAQNTQAVEVTGIKLANQDGVDVYEVVLGNGNVLYINALTGEIISDASNDDAVEQESGDDVPLTQTQLDSVKVSFADAVAIAKNRYPGVAVEDVELEVEDGGVVFSIDFIDDTRIDVSADSGEVVRFKTDNVDERANDADDSRSDDSQSDADSSISDDDSSNSGSRDSDDDEDNSDSGTSDDDNNEDSSNSGSSDEDNSSSL